MAKVTAKENERFDTLLRRFSRLVDDLGVIKEVRSREAFEKPTTERKRKASAAVKRHQKALKAQQLPERLF